MQITKLLHIHSHMICTNGVIRGHKILGRSVSCSSRLHPGSAAAPCFAWASSIQTFTFRGRARISKILACLIEFQTRVTEQCEACVKFVFGVIIRLCNIAIRALNTDLFHTILRSSPKLWYNDSIRLATLKALVSFTLGSVQVKLPGVPYPRISCSLASKMIQFAISSSSGSAASLLKPVIYEECPVSSRMRRVKATVNCGLELRGNGPGSVPCRTSIPKEAKRDVTSETIVRISSEAIVCRKCIESY